MAVKFCPHCESKIFSEHFICPNCGGYLCDGAMVLNEIITYVIPLLNIGGCIIIGFAMVSCEERGLDLLFRFARPFALCCLFSNVLLCGLICSLRRNMTKLRESCCHMEYMITEIFPRNNEKYNEQEQCKSEGQR